MKYLRISTYLMLCVSSFGLISCSPDKSSDQSQAFKVADSFKIKNLDGRLTPRELQSRQLESLTSQIILTNNGQPISGRSEVDLKISSECNSGQKIERFKSTAKLKASYPLFELVAPSIWLDHPKNQNIWNCDFHFSALDQKNNQHIFEIKDVIIKNTAAGLLSSLKKDGVTSDIDPSTPLVIHENELEYFTVVYDESGAERMSFQCDEYAIPLLGKNSDFQNLSDLNMDRAFDKVRAKRTPLCRVGIFKDSRLVGISPLIRLVFDNDIGGGKISLQKLTAGYSIFDRRRNTEANLWIVSLSNNTNSTNTYLVDFSKSANARISFAYKSGRSGWQSHKLIFRQLDTNGGVKVLEQHRHFWKIRLEPNASIRFRANTKFNKLCQMIELGAVISRVPSPEVSQVIESRDGDVFEVGQFDLDFGSFEALAFSLSSNPHDIENLKNIEGLNQVKTNCK